MSQTQSTDEWQLVGGETFVHSAYYESGPGEPEVDEGWTELVNDTASRALAGKLRRIVPATVDVAPAAAVVQAVVRVIGVYDPAQVDHADSLEIVAAETDPR